MSYLLGIAGGCLAALLLFVCLCIYAVRAKKCCFQGKSEPKETNTNGSRVVVAMKNGIKELSRN